MGLKDFTNNTGGAGGSGSSGGSGFPPGFPPINMGAMSQQVDDVTDMLIDYNERFKGADPALFRDALIVQVIGVLIGKKKPNPLLVGPAGVGKTAVVEEIARLIATKSPLIPPQLADRTIYELPLSNLVAGAGIVGELEDRLTKIVDFASDPKNKAVLFVDEIHLLTDSHNQTYQKISQILKPALARGDMKLIGATTSQEARGFDDDPAFKRRFSRLIVDEFTPEQTEVIIDKARTSYSTHYGHKVSLAPEMVPYLVRISDERKRADAHRPDSALTLLDRAMADAVMAHTGAIRKAQDAGDQIVVQALSSIATIPLSEQRILLTAEHLLTGQAQRPALDVQALTDDLARIKGQDAILPGLVTAIERSRLGVFPSNRPLAWMFAGASGSGKTEVAKIIAQALTHEDPIILNMTEYIHESSITRIIGAPPGYIGSDSDAELPFDALEANPHRVILLDEFEKADKSVAQLFLSALDEGYIKTARGKVLDFSKAIVIATTNAAREAITRTPVGFSTPSAGELNTRQLNRALAEHFAPELLGRFTDTIAFAPITEAVYAEILSDVYAREAARIIEQNPRVQLPAQLTGDELDQITAKTYDAPLGARPAITAVRAHIEDLLLAAQRQAALLQGGGPLTDIDDTDVD